MVTTASSLTLDLLALATLCHLLGGPANGEPAVPHSPYEVAWSPDGGLLATSDRTGDALWLVDAASRKVRHRVALRGHPTGVAWTGGGRSVLVAEFGGSSVAEVDPKQGTVLRRLAVDPHPEGLAVAPRRGLLLVANSTTHCVSLVDLGAGEPIARIRVPREPHRIAVTPDEKIAVVGNLLPAGRASDAGMAAVVSLIDLEKATHLGDVPLPPGSTTVRHVAMNRDGSRVYVAHLLARNSVPSTQLERGWVNTDALSILDLRQRSLLATVLLDNPVRGAADPWGVAVAADDKTLWVTLSGVHEIARIDLERLERFLAGVLPDDPQLAGADGGGPVTESVWQRIRRDPAHRSELANDLAALTSADLIRRIPVPVKGPRGLALSPDGAQLAAAGYFSGAVVLLDAGSGRVAGTVQLGEAVAPDLARRGEMIFHDATRCFQHWLSCATCHPNDGRIDGLNWDLPLDGIGNPKNNKSLLLAQHTPPMTWLGSRKDMDSSVEKGFLFLMRRPEPGEVEAVRAYIRSLKPLPSPYVGKGLEAAIERGRQLFHDSKTRCARCHEGEYLTDGRSHDVGTRSELDRVARFDTPSLIEVYRTAPYLHDGSAATLREVLSERNAKDRHGVVSHLSEEQIEDLVAYLRSL